MEVICGVAALSMKQRWLVDVVVDDGFNGDVVRQGTGCFVITTWTHGDLQVLVLVSLARTCRRGWLGGVALRRGESGRMLTVVGVA